MITAEQLQQNDIQNLKGFQPEDWPPIVPIIKDYLRMPFCYPYKYIIDKKIAGIGTGIGFGKTAWLAHIIVKKEYRNKGFGSLIVNDLCNTLKNLGCKTISLITTEPGFPVYKKAGFKEQTQYVSLKREKTLKNVTVSKNIIPITDKTRDEVFTLDKKISGEDRRYLLIDNFKNTYVYNKNYKTAGYYLPDLGEGLIMADNVEAGIELLKFRNTEKNNAVLPCENIDGIKFLKENGFVETARLRRMISGKKFVWSPDKLFNRIGGNFG